MRIAFRKLVAIYCDASFLDLDEIRFDEFVMQILEERDDVVLEVYIRMSFLSTLHCLHERERQV